VRRRAEWYPNLGEPPRRRRRRWVRNVVAAPWRWRWELGVPAGLEVLAETTHPLVACGVVAAGAVGVLAAGPRRWMTSRAWGVLLQHRLRVGMSECDLTTWSGRLPAIVATRVVDRGVVMTVWTPPGLGVHDFRAAASNLAVACWAAEVEVDRHPRFAQLVHVLVRPHRDDD
jgi:hypothetical protein